MGLFNRIDQRANVMGRMAETLDVDITEAFARHADTVRAYRQAVMRCTFCPHDNACTAWMDAHAHAEAAPDYCRNKDIFDSVTKL